MFKKSLLLSALSAMAIAFAVPSVANTMEEIKVEAIQAKQFSIENEPIAEVGIPIKINDLGFNSVSSLKFESFVYSGGVYKQVNSNKLAFKKPNVTVVNFADMQNKNFERMRLAS